MTAKAIRRPRWLLPLIQAARRANPNPSFTARDLAGFLAVYAFWLLLVIGAVSGAK
jgi:hypothetical protein